MNSLSLEKTTRQRIEAFTRKPTHAVVLVGQKGIGKKAMAISLAENVLKIDDLGKYPYVKILGITDKDKSIGVESVRKLDEFLKLKVTGNRAFDRVIIVENAEMMTIQAQNAFLKTLEEPPSGVLIILTSTYLQALLPTVISRLSVININKPNKDDLNISDLADHDKFNQAYSISGGLPGLVEEILNNPAHPLLKATELARRLLSQSVYERLLSVDELAKDKPLCINTIYILQQMAHLALQSASGVSTKKWQQILKASYKAQQALDHSAQIKLVLSDLMMSL
jgi:DNA polymerase-3 subunit delta'